MINADLVTEARNGIFHDLGFFLGRERKYQGDLRCAHGNVAAELTVTMQQAARMEKKLRFILANFLVEI